MMMLREQLSKSLADHSGSVVGNLSEQFTFEKLRNLVDVKSRALAKALDASGDETIRIAIIRKNSPAYVSDFLAVLEVGGIPFLVDPVLGANEIETLHEHCGFNAILHDGSARLPSTGQVTERAGILLWLPTGLHCSRQALHSDTELCRLTSGSTRSPACIEFSGAAVLAAAHAWRSASELNAKDRILCFAGLYNGLAFNTSLIPGLLSGANLFFPSGLPSPSNVMRHFDSFDPTVFVAFPAAYDHLAASDTNELKPTHLRLALSSAARLSLKTSESLANRSIRVADYYGIAETGPLTFNSDPTPGGGQGYPLPGVSLRFEDFDGGSGVLLAKSRSMGTRYLNFPGQLENRITADGHFQTTDRGTVSSKGELHLAGRLGRSFDLGGRKFSSDEVDDLLVSHPAITAGVAAVVAPLNGRPFLGAVAVRTGDIDALELRRHFLTRVAPFKVPERIVFVDALPVNGAGKIQVAEVEQILLNDVSSQGSCR